MVISLGFLGIEDGMTVRLHGKGDAPVDGPGSRGDLIVRVSVAPSKQFRRQGVNLYHEARIPLQTALLGGRTRVPTLDDPVDVRVPAGTQQGEKMVIRGRGVQSALDGKGDLFVEFHVQLPRQVIITAVFCRLTWPQIAYGSSTGDTARVCR